MHHVGAKRFLPGLRRVADRQRADIADDGVDTAEFGGSTLDPCFNAAGSATSIALPHDLTPFAARRLHDLADLVGVARADRDVGAFGRKQFGDRKPNALAAAGHQDALSLQSEIHRRLRCDPR